MPIYEFKCSKCEEFFELIFMGPDDNKQIVCPKCHSQEFERVISKTNFAVSNSSDSGHAKGVQTQERQCSSGSCKTYTIAGEN